MLACVMKQWLPLTENYHPLKKEIKQSKEKH